jgi:predicted Fe-Mo cluster-binding NifX family protein
MNMISVAIPVFLDRISPRLDCAQKLLVLKIDGNRLMERSELDISRWLPDEKIVQLRKMGIDQLICGGLRLEDRSGLLNYGIQVASPFYGEVETIIKEYLKGDLDVSCRRAGRRRKRCHHEDSRQCQRKGSRFRS